MLELYIKKYTGKNKIIDLNDMWFDSNVHNVRIDANVIERVDKSKYLGNYKVESRFNKTIVDITEISTGCKTVLNIMSFPNIVFSVSECGDNALREVLSLKEGMALIEYFVIPESFNNKIKVIYDSSEIVINNNKQLENILNRIFVGEK